MSMLLTFYRVRSCAVLDVDAAADVVEAVDEEKHEQELADASNHHHHHHHNQYGHSTAAGQQPNGATPQYPPSPHLASGQQSMVNHDHEAGACSPGVTMRSARSHDGFS